MSRRPTERELRRALALATRAHEALADGELALASLILENLADDLGRALGPQPRVRCPDCGLGFDWPGLREHHRLFAHPEKRTAA